MSTDAGDPAVFGRTFGALEARVGALEARALEMTQQLYSNHTETMVQLREMRSILDRQAGGVKVLHVLGGIFMGIAALSGWFGWFLGWWPRKGN